MNRGASLATGWGSLRSHDRAHTALTFASSPMRDVRTPLPHSVSTALSKYGHAVLPCTTSAVKSGCVPMVEGKRGGVLPCKCTA